MWSCYSAVRGKRAPCCQTRDAALLDLVVLQRGSQGCACAGSCTQLGTSLRDSCGSVVNAVNQNADNIVSATCQGLRNAVANAARSGVSPSGSCALKTRLRACWEW